MLEEMSKKQRSRDRVPKKKKKGGGKGQGRIQGMGWTSSCLRKKSSERREEGGIKSGKKLLLRGRVRHPRGVRNRQENRCNVSIPQREGALKKKKPREGRVDQIPTRKGVNKEEQRSKKPPQRGTA